MTDEEMRAHFAAQAPADIPSWFQPAMDHLPLPDMPSLPDVLGGKAKEKQVRSRGFVVQDFLDTELQDTANSYDTAWQEWRQKKRQVEARREEYRYFAWRWYYADQVIRLKDVNIDSKPAS